MTNLNLYYLRMFRLSEPKSLKEISELANISYDKLCKYERGLHNPSVKTLRKLANLYQQTLEELEDGAFYKEIEEFMKSKKI